LLDRLRLDDARAEALARQLEATAGLPPLEREAGSWTLANGLRVSERRVPIGTVGANFEARWKAELAVRLLDEYEFDGEGPDQVAVFCPRCWSREFSNW
jgi:gamma-glutamyl phosphate reductase